MVKIMEYPDIGMLWTVVLFKVVYLSGMYIHIFADISLG